jgi:hypothetical protein
MLSCSCLSIEPQSLSIPARGSASLQLSLDLTKKTPDEINLDVRDFSAHIVPVVLGESVQKQWTITGRVREAIHCNPEFVYFGDKLIKGDQYKAQFVDVTTCLDLRNIEILSVPPAVSVDVARKDSGHYQLAIHPHSDLTIGPFKSVLILRPIGLDGAKKGEAVVTVEGVVVADIQAMPSAIAFGSRRLNDEATESVIIRSSAEKAFRLTGFSCDSPTTTVEPMPTVSGSGYAFQIKQRISELGHHSALIVFHAVRANGTDDETFAIHLTVSFHGFDLIGAE